MDSNPYLQSARFVDLLTSQQGVFNLVDDSEASSHRQDSPAASKEPRRMWTIVEDNVLISAWLNTSKDPVVGNEQRSGAFWKRIAAYFAASPNIAATEHREASHCKQRWHKINDGVNKFCGAYAASTREKTSGQNEEDVLTKAREIYLNNHGKKFCLEHAWRELRNDQKWCTIATSKRRKLDEGSQCESSHAQERITEEVRPPGVKAAKGKRKKDFDGKETLSQFQTLCELKQKDTKLKILHRLLAKKDGLDEFEDGLKKKLIEELF